MAERDSFGSFFMGFIAGAIAGAIVTILYAPNSGEETRGTLKNKKDELIEKANLSVDDAYKQAETAAQNARDSFEALASTTRERAEDVTRRGQVILEERLGGLKEKAQKKVEDEILMKPEE